MGLTNGLSAAELLELSDAGEAASFARRGLLLLEAARGVSDPASVSLGARDAAVFELRRATFGDAVSARISCPGCGLLLATAIAAEELAFDVPGEDWPVAVTVSVGEFTVEARTPDGRALVRAAALPDLSLAREELVSACVVSASYCGEAVDPLALPDEVVAAVGEALLEADPRQEVRVDLTCAGCGFEWAPVFDPVLFLWREIKTTSVQILDDVHELATGYGWSEEEVLKLSSRRRRRYVERLVGE